MPTRPVGAGPPLANLPAVGAPPLMVTLRQLVLQTRDSLDTQLGTSRAAECRSIGASLPVVTTVERTRLALRGLPLTD